MHSVEQLLTSPPSKDWQHMWGAQMYDGHRLCFQPHLLYCSSQNGCWHDRQHGGQSHMCWSGNNCKCPNTTRTHTIYAPPPGPQTSPWLPHIAYYEPSMPFLVKARGHSWFCNHNILDGNWHPSQGRAYRASCYLWVSFAHIVRMNVGWSGLPWHRLPARGKIFIWLWTSQTGNS